MSPVASRCPNLHPQHPWLLFPIQYSDVTKLHFFSHTGHPIGTFKLLDEKWVYGSTHGWLVILGPSYRNTSAMVSLLNPITRAHIQLPPLPKKLNLRRNGTKVLLCSHPVAPFQPGQLLIALWTSDNKLTVLRQGDDNWFYQGRMQRLSWSREFAYFDGELYSVSYRGRLAVHYTTHSLTNGVLKICPPPRIPNDFHCYLVVAAGDLLLVVYYLRGDTKPPNLVVYKLDRSRKEGKGGFRWVEFEDGIGGNSLFVSEHQCMSICDPDFPLDRGNQIYFAPGMIPKVPSRPFNIVLVNHVPNRYGQIIPVLPDLIPGGLTWLRPSMR